MPPTTSPGNPIGKITYLKAWNGLHPKSKDASNQDKSTKKDESKVVDADFEDVTDSKGKDKDKDKDNGKKEKSA